MCEKYQLEISSVTMEQYREIINKAREEAKKDNSELYIRLRPLYSSDTPTKCEYCDLNNYTPDFPFNDETQDDYRLIHYIGSGVYMLYMPHKQLWQISNEWSHPMQIHYCPFCGRILEEE